MTDYYRQREDGVSLECASTQKLASPDTVPEHWAIRNERLRLLARALHTLAPEKQEALALRFFADLKYGEIAPLRPSYLPAGFQSWMVKLSGKAGRESIELVYHFGDQFVAITQGKRSCRSHRPATSHRRGVGEGYRKAPFSLSRSIP